jgi:CRISPR-associated protein Cmr6
MPRPLYTHSSLTFNPQTAHAGLWYDKFCDQWKNDWTLPAEQKVQWIRAVANGTRTGDAALLSQFARRLQSMVESLGGKCLPLHTESRFVTGLGREHPVESGFAWHPTLGTPHLPGSSIKGMLRAWAIFEGQADAADKILGCQESPDGAGGQVGMVIIFDAIPLGPVKLEVDVMTPHYADYYGSGDVPGDWLSPVPIPFLAVGAGTTFQFGIAPRITDGKEYLEAVAEWLKNALQWLGAGAKTAVGYGRFEHGKGKIDEPSPTAISAKLPQYKAGDVVSVTRAEDPKPKAGKPRVWFVADDGFGGVVAGGSPPEIEIGASIQLEVAAVMQHGGYNFRVPKGMVQARK